MASKTYKHAQSTNLIIFKDQAAQIMASDTQRKWQDVLNE